MASIAFSPNGTRVVAGFGFGMRWWHICAEAKIWDATTGQELLTFSRKKGVGVRSVAYSPDGQRIVTGSEYGAVAVWDATTGRSLWIVNGHASAINSVAFSRDGERIASASDDYSIKLWDAAEGRELLVLHQEGGCVTSVAFNPKGDRLVSGSSDETVRIWEATTGQELLALRQRGSGGKVAFSPDGKLVLTNSSGGLRTFEAAKHRSVFPLRGHVREVTCAEFSPDGRQIASGSADDTIQLWDAATGQRRAIFRGHTEGIRGVAFSRDSQRIIGVSGNGEIKCWNVITGQELFAHDGHKGCVECVALSPEGRRIVSRCDDGIIRVWDSTSKEEATWDYPYHTGFRIWGSMAISPDGNRLVVESSRGANLSLCDANTGQEIWTVSTMSWGDVQVLAFSPDGSRIASGASVLEGEHDIGAIRIWEAATGRELCNMKLNIKDWRVDSVAFSPDGKSIVSGSNGFLRLWDVVTGQQLRVLQGKMGQVNSVAFSPDGTHIVSGSADKKVRVWDLSSDGWSGYT